MEQVITVSHISQEIFKELIEKKPISNIEKAFPISGNAFSML
ncbi:hypothetical protein BACERE00191_04905 [Bacillus pacificus]|uniref:Uncharacterized protein n=1 Tax=Bacillus pacificus TaxID=2026187 RepID=A0A1Y6ALF2_9BACI|nr:hypothetical protein BACERE00191_04905 [Bacillus pacificus]